MRWKKGVSRLLVAAMVLSLSGCNAAVEETVSTEIELIEPVNAASNMETVARRNLYDVTVYSASVYPAVQEYAFDKDMTVERYGFFFGEEVKKGDVLVYGSTKSIDDQIEAMEEKITSMEESFAEAEKQLQESLADSQEQYDFLKWGAEAYENIEPQETVYESSLKSEEEKKEETVSGGDSTGKTENEKKEDKLVRNPEHIKWEKEAERFIGPFRIMEHSRNVQLENFRQKKELYELEHAYYLEQLADLKAKRKENVLVAKASGTVMALRSGNSNWIAAESAMVAIGNPEEKYLKCDYINKTDVSSAEDLYAMINGVRYEIEYQPMPKDEYARITAGGGKAYSTFLLKGDTAQVEIGDFAVITLYRKKKEQVISVSKESLHKDETGYFVYGLQDGENVPIPVKIGYSDGVFTEITAGLSEGDRIMVEKEVKYNEKTVTIEKGKFQSSFKQDGYMYYPIVTAVKNTVEHGTTYFGEYLVAEHAHVEKGDLIATVRVVIDATSLQRYKIRLTRAQERLADLREAGEEENEKAIEAKLEEIADLEEQIAEIEADAAVKEIRATTSGVVTELAELEKEDIVAFESNIAEIADEDTCYVVVEDQNQLLNYGNEVAISYTNSNKEKKQTTGMVVNLSAAGVSKELQGENAFILVPKEAVPDMLVSNTEIHSWWDVYRYNVTADIREMENVLVVPKSAVTEKKGFTYVDVMDKEGNVTTCRFVAGGYDSKNYWVIEGLSEGMVVCLK